MVNNNNSETTRELIDAGKLQVVQGVPQTIANYIQPVMEVNPKLLRRITITRDNTKTTTGSAIIYTTPATQDFYLVGYTISVIKDVACDAATGGVAFISVVIDGATRTFGNIVGITLTAQNEAFSHSFPIPMKIDRSTTILITGPAHAAGVLVKSGSIFGYVVDNSNA